MFWFQIGNLEQQVTQQRSQNSTSDHNSKQSELKSENVKLKVKYISNASYYGRELFKLS